MPMGSTQTVVVCIPVATSSAMQQVSCPVVDGQFFAPATIQAYLISADQAALIDAATSSFDYGYASAVWALAFTTVVGLFLISHSIGLVLGFIRRG